MEGPTCSSTLEFESSDLHALTVRTAAQGDKAAASFIDFLENRCTARSGQCDGTCLPHHGFTIGSTPKSLQACLLCRSPPPPQRVSCQWPPFSEHPELQALGSAVRAFKPLLAHPAPQQLHKAACVTFI